jgi:predicted RNA-binding Zn-ribbon protein involved in translation (DUF1610 family)
MKLGFEEAQTPYASGSQGARVWTERWVKDWVYCPNCGNPKINRFPNNSPVADFYCVACQEEYELKSQKSVFGNKVLDGSFRTKCARLAASNNPSLPHVERTSRWLGIATTIDVLVAAMNGQTSGPVCVMMTVHCGARHMSPYESDD